MKNKIVKIVDTALVATIIIVILSFSSVTVYSDVQGGWIEPFPAPILTNICNVADRSDAHPSVVVTGSGILIYYADTDTLTTTPDGGGKDCTKGTAIWLAKFQVTENGLTLALTLATGYPKQLTLPSASGYYPNHPEALMLPSGQVRLYYALWNLTSTGWIGIKAADSTDGETSWIDQSSLRCDTGTCVYPSPDPASNQAYSMHVVFTPISQYEAWISQAAKIMYGTSSDGLMWNINAIPSIPKSDGFWKPSVIKRPIGSSFRYDIWFSMTQNNKGWPDIGIGHAYGYNGYDWELDSDNPILSIESPPSWRNQRTGTPAVVWIGPFDNQNEFAMFFGGLNSASGRFSIGLALYPKANTIETVTSTSTSSTTLTSTVPTTIYQTTTTVTSTSYSPTVTSTFYSPTVTATATSTSYVSTVTTPTTTTSTSTIRTTVTNASTTLTGSTTITQTSTTTSQIVSSSYITESFHTTAWVTTTESVTEPPWITLIAVLVVAFVMVIVVYNVVQRILRASREREQQQRFRQPGIAEPSKPTP